MSLLPDQLKIYVNASTGTIFDPRISLSGLLRAHMLFSLSSVVHISFTIRCILMFMSSFFISLRMISRLS